METKVTAAGLLIALALGVLTARTPSGALFAVAASTAVLGIILVPDVVLTFIAALSLVHSGSRLGALIPGQYLLAVLLLACLVSMALRSPRPKSTYTRAVACALPSVVLAGRLATADNAQWQAALACGATAAGAALMGPRERHRAATFLFAFALGFALISFFSPMEEAGRLAGVSGNPNRMVYALLTLAPFVFLRTSGRAIIWSALYLLVAGALISGSGSAQALPALVVLTALVGTMRASAPGRRSTYRLPQLAAGATLIALAVVILREATQALSEKLSTNLSDLSGRSTFFEIAWSRFLDSPVLGTGSSRVLTDLVDGGRSTHNTYLAVLALAGLLAAVPLLYVLWRIAGNAAGMFRRLDPVLPAVCVTGVLAMVQSLELLPWTWLLVGFAAARMTPSTLRGAPAISTSTATHRSGL